MQLAKSSSSICCLSICCLLILSLSWCGWGSCEAQDVSSSNNFSSRISHSSRAVQKVRHTIRVDGDLGGSGQNRFIVHQDDRPPEDTRLDREQSQSNGVGRPRSRSLLDLDLIDDENVFESEEENELDFDSDPDRRPSRPEFGPWPKKGIGGINLDVRENNVNAPEDVSQQLIGSSQSDWNAFFPHQKVFAWAAPEIRYQPLYFEDAALERYGTTAGPYHQSFISSFHFFKDFVFLPHKMRHDAPASCDHPLGFCRPGNSTPYVMQRHYFGRPRR